MVVVVSVMERHGIEYVVAASWISESLEPPKLTPPRMFCSAGLGRSEGPNNQQLNHNGSTDCQDYDIVGSLAAAEASLPDRAEVSSFFRHLLRGTSPALSFFDPPSGSGPDAYGAGGE